MTITFFVAGTPKAQPRPRAFARKIGNTFMARVYDAGTAEEWKSQIALAAREHLPAQPIAGPVHAHITFLLPRPKGHYNSKGEVRSKNEDPRHGQKPDVDNLTKAVLDALSQIGMWTDDAQLWNVEVTKLWAGKTVEAGAEINLEWE